MGRLTPMRLQSGQADGLRRRIRCAVFSVAVLLAATASMPSSVRAQEPSAQQPNTGIQRALQYVPQLMVAPNAPLSVPDPDAQSGGGDKTANICLELEAFLEQQAAKAASASSQNSAQNAPALREQSTSQSAAASGQSPAQGGPAPQASSQGTAQPSADQDPPILDPPQRTSGLSARIPAGGTAAKPPIVTLDKVRAYASANDVRACQEAVRQMRRAGVALPNGLLALAALRPELLEGAVKQ
jgi:hypothetical protein